MADGILRHVSRTTDMTEYRCIHPIFCLFCLFMSNLFFLSLTKECTLAPWWQCWNTANTYRMLIPVYLTWNQTSKAFPTWRDTYDMKHDSVSDATRMRQWTGQWCKLAHSSRLESKLHASSGQ
ncbi:hypothetical protein MPSEU_000524700 [Mayamaea pseudoterrestris]|nr:hypothetical protein MPSEU_000524700 [Mayamaea pseudoterrestris]